jgi:hypothetical protein
MYLQKKMQRKSPKPISAVLRNCLFLVLYDDTFLNFIYYKCKREDLGKQMDEDVAIGYYKNRKPKSLFQNNWYHGQNFRSGALQHKAWFRNITQYFFGTVL